MVIGKAISIALITLILTMIVKRQSREIAWAVTAAGGVLLLGLVWEPLREIWAQMEMLGKDTALDKGQMELIIKSVAITLACEAAASLCREAGETALGQKVEWVCHVLVLAMALPVLLSVTEMLRKWAALL